MCTRDKGSNCRTNNVTYEFKCTICDDVYIGETARNLFTRGREHMMDYDKKKDNSVLYRHALTKHSESETRPLFKARVTGSYNSALTRQLSEANQIELAGAKAINTKTEWRHSQIARSQIVISWTEDRSNFRLMMMHTHWNMSQQVSPVLSDNVLEC